MSPELRPQPARHRLRVLLLAVWMVAGFASMQPVAASEITSGEHGDREHGKNCACGVKCRGASCCCGPKRAMPATAPDTAKGAEGPESVVITVELCMGMAFSDDAGLPTQTEPTRLFGKMAAIRLIGNRAHLSSERLITRPESVVCTSPFLARLDEPPEAVTIV